MPKIEADRADLLRLAGLPPDLPDSGLEELLANLKGELDSMDGDTIKIELNDTNRPDLWCAEGVARGLRCWMDGPEKHLESVGSGADSPTMEVLVDPAMRDIRPWIACFRATGWKLDEKGLEALIRVQEKLTDSFGRKRSTAAIGFHRAAEIAYPVSYDPASPDTSFEPLGEGRRMSLEEILRSTEKGVLYAPLLDGLDRYPVLRDSSGEPFSFPPVINSDTTGRVRPGDDDLFCDVTGTDWETVQLTATILACNLEDRGAVIEPVLTSYPFSFPGNPEGGRFLTPHRFADSLEASRELVESILGVELDAGRILESLGRFDYTQLEVGELTVSGTLPPYRHDGIHPVDMVEDIAIGLGHESFEPQPLEEFTIGRTAPTEDLADAIRTLLAGAGCEEVMRPVLTSLEKIDSRTGTPEPPVSIENVMTLEYGVVRNSLIPGLLEVESGSAHASYPHRIFEEGEIVVVGPGRECITRRHLAVLVAGNDVSLGDAHSILGSLCHLRSLELSLNPVERESDQGPDRDAAKDRRFIEGRIARVSIEGTDCGVIGEIHPGILENWGLSRPVSVFEIDLESLGG